MKKVLTVNNCKRCRTCEHETMLASNVACCLYIIDEGEPRPCPVSEDCTGYKKRTSRRVGMMYLTYGGF